MTFVLPSDAAHATPGLSQMSDADLQAIAGSSGGRPNFSDIERAFPSAPTPQVPGPSFADDLTRSFPPRGVEAPDLSSVSDEALRKIAGSNGTAPPVAGPQALLSDADVGLAPTAPPTAGPQQGFLSDADVGIAPPPSVGADVAKSAASGISSGIQGLIGMGGNIRHAADYGALWAEAKIAEKLGRLPAGQTADDVIAKYRGSAGRAFMSGLGLSDTAADVLGAGAPSTADVNRVADVAGLPSHQPQTTAGKYA